MLDGIEDLKQRAEQAGRAMDTISISVFGAPPRQEVLDAYVEAGVDRVILPLPPRGRDRNLPRLDRYATLRT